MAPFQATVLSHDDPQKQLSHASRLILIDNYDSFTYNVSQYLFLEGANVEVLRNDAVTLEELIAKKPTQLVVSPGPGHPETDAGISEEAIKYFAGKIPILGVCMGEQCIFTAFGGTVASANEILHGKTSDILHDDYGVYKGVEQSMPVTRYHSLAGTYETLPDCLEVTSWSPDKGIIMGVRHKEYAMEGMQYHPESILTLTGRQLFRNFLKWNGGLWRDIDRSIVGDVGNSNQYTEWRKTHDLGSNGTTEKEKSKLDEIFANRREQVATQKQIPGQRMADLEKAHNLSIAPPLVSFVERLRSTPFKLALMAEIKRASPSKGIIDIDANAAVQARRYASINAATISVLTEPTWFKGSIEDLRVARMSVDGLAHRPAILRKEFVFDEYQILEARLSGADTILLIVKMLSKELLTRLYKYSVGLGMEPLVEVNNTQEMHVALELGAKVIGVNNRDLHSFKVDLDTTTSLSSMKSTDTILCALSGISGRKDVEKYETEGVNAVLVGEALMRAGDDLEKYVGEMMGPKKADNSNSAVSHQDLLVKVCGTRTPEAAKLAAESGADMVGIILVKGSKRCVPLDVASEISRVLRETKKNTEYNANDDFTIQELNDSDTSPTNINLDFFSHHHKYSLNHPTRTLLVGVFQNQPLSYILRVQKLLDLDIVQLHGTEPLEYAHLIPVPVIRAFKPGEAGLCTKGYHAIPLLDSGSGGCGISLPKTEISQVLHSGTTIMLAGGLNPDTIYDVVRGYGALRQRIGGVDVSSGVETNSKQDLAKIKKFVQEAKRAASS